MTRRCSIETCRTEIADSPLAGPAHARKHKSEFEELVGRPPEDYDEVRALFNRGEWPDSVGSPPMHQVTLGELEGET